MKVILIGTDHANKESEVKVEIEYPRVGIDDWTFTVAGMEFTVSDLTETMVFLKRMANKD